MQPHLPKPIADYIAADNGDDKEAFGLCFNDNAVVRDEGHTYEGLTVATLDCAPSNPSLRSSP